MTDLWSSEAETKILGYLFNPFIKKENKEQLLQVIFPDHFVDEKLKLLYHAIKLHRVFDKIVLYEKLSSLKIRDIDEKFLREIDDYVTEAEVESYVTIIQDKYQKRRVYEFAREMQQDILDGADQFEVALKAQTVLRNLGSKVKLETNQELLEQVLGESKSEIISTGYELIDKYIGGYSRGMVVTIAGDSGHMKTTLALDMAFKMAENSTKARIGIFSKEMLATDLMKKQISRICGIPTNEIFGQKYDKEFVREKMMQSEVWRENRVRLINPATFSSVADIAKIQMTHKFDVWFLDFIQLLEFSKVASNSSDYNIQIGQNMRNLQSLALATKSVGIILSQVRKGIEHRRDKKPTISDIEWSGLIKQLSSYIFFSYYPGKYYGFDTIPADHYYLIAEKTRFAENFLYPMMVDPALGLFTEIHDPTQRKEMVNKLKSIVD